MIPAIFRQLLVFSKFACTPPTLQVSETHKYNKTTNHYGNNSSVEVVSMNYIPFGEKSITICVKLYQSTAMEESVMQEHILHEIIKVILREIKNFIRFLSFYGFLFTNRLYAHLWL